MLFSSFTYLFCFLPLTVVAYFMARRRGNAWAKGALLICSLIFYAAAGPQFIPVLAGSLLFNYFISYKLIRATGTKAILMAGLAGNLGILCIFKYAYFVQANVNALFGTHFAIPVMALPAGVSFFTIQQIMYLVDRAEGLVDHQNILDHAVFISFFPYVLMGPIVRAGQLLSQFSKPHLERVNFDNVSRGVSVVLMGLFKKAVLAGTFARWADLGYAYTGHLSLIDSWLTAVAFTFQLYFDFSGYTDMALGSALILNITLPQNFDAPFRARSIIEFWRRWHITLTDFITSYLYTPIVRSFQKVTFAKAMLATLIAMGLAGLWHGAAWTYVVFGLAHGAALVVNNWSRRRKLRISPFLSRVLTLAFLVFAFVVFRAPTLAKAGEMLHAMILPTKLFDYTAFRVMDNVEQVVGVLWMLFGACIAFAGPTSAEFQRDFQPRSRTLAMTAAAAIISLLYLNSLVSQGFLYRDF